MTQDQLQSPQINELVTALVAAKKEFNPLIADVKGNYGEYASSDAIKESTEAALLAHGLVFVQNRVFVDGRTLLQSRIMHVSGQYIAAYMLLTIPENARSIDQEYGKSTTYQRRYDAYGMLGLGKGDGVDPDSYPTITCNQLATLKELLKGKFDREKALCKHYGISNLSMLAHEHMNEVLDILQDRK